MRVPGGKRLLLLFVGVLLLLQVVFFVFKAGWRNHPYSPSVTEERHDQLVLFTAWDTVKRRAGSFADRIGEAIQNLRTRETQQNHTHIDNADGQSKEAIIRTRVQECVRGEQHTMLYNNNDNLPRLLVNTDWFFTGDNNPRVYGTSRQKEGYLTIGISSVGRPNTNKIYLFDTLSSLIDQTKKEERSLVTLVVFLADRNSSYNNYVADALYQKYAQECNEGFLHILIAKENIYPNMDKLRRTFNDSIPRVKWRTKMNVDFAFLNLYSRNISKYYINLEDDVMTEPGYFQRIKTFIDGRKDNWFMIDFAKKPYTGSRGQCFKSSDLARVAHLLLTFHDEMPTDWLIDRMRNIMSQKSRIIASKGLFVHVGKQSSLHGQTRNFR